MCGLWIGKAPPPPSHRCWAYRKQLSLDMMSAKEIPVTTGRSLARGLARNTVLRLLVMSGRSDCSAARPMAVLVRPPRSLEQDQHASAANRCLMGPVPPNRVENRIGLIPLRRASSCTDTAGSVDRVDINDRRLFRSIFAVLLHPMRPTRPSAISLSPAMKSWVPARTRASISA